MNRTFSLLVIALLLTPGAANAADALMITPTRVIIDGRDREAKVTLTNTGDETGNYRMFFVNYRMTEAGEFEPVTGATATAADKMVRYSPKQVELPPGTTQTARLVLRKPAGLADGEYRSHLVFQSIPKQAPAEQSSTAKGRASAKFTTLYGVSIPVIVRHGKTSAQVSFGEPKLVEENGKQWILVNIERTGNQSVYGDIAVTLGSGDKAKVIGESNGLAVYTDVAKRLARIPVEMPAGSSAALRLTYRNPVDNSVMAEKEFKLR